MLTCVVEWLTLDVVEDLDKSQEARNSGWNELVIPNRFSSLLLSLVSNHISGVSSRQWESSTKHGPSVQIDLVRGKGKGLIILLHGRFSIFAIYCFSSPTCQLTSWPKCPFLGPLSFIRTKRSIRTTLQIPWLPVLAID